ncbi:MAG: imidazolonepropionase-like amidohydrolase [Planctomycetota bacterium]|jgi:imidazolonepropionase-like amidohydrolase
MLLRARIACLLLGSALLGSAIAAPQGGDSVAGELGGPGLAVFAAKAMSMPLEGPQAVHNAVMLVRDGKIEAIGRRSELIVPDGYEHLDLGAAWITPGFIDLHCHVAGKFGLNDMVYLANPGLRASADVVPETALLIKGAAAGVTTVLYIPGSGTNMGGQGVLLKTSMPTYEQMEIRNPGSLKLAQAGNPERFLMGVGRSVMNWNTRNTFKRGLAYAKARATESGADRPRKNIQMEVFDGLYHKALQVSTHTQLYQVVLMTITMVRQEMGLEVFIDHGSFDGWRTAALAEKEGVNAILGPRQIAPHLRIQYRGFNIVNDTEGAIFGMAAQYQALGHTRIGFNTDSPVIPQEELPLQAAMATRYGFKTPNADQLRGLTIIPAVTAGISHRVGSLEVGKDADFIVTAGDPVDPRVAVSMTFIEGRRVYDAKRDGQRW